MIGMILVTHGRLAEEFVHAMEHVVGEQGDVATVCIGPHDDMEAKRKEIAKAIKQVDSGSGAVILTDLFGGTPSNLAISLLKAGKTEVIAGINLPMLIRLAGARKDMTLAAAAKAARDAGRNYITIASEFLGQEAQIEGTEGELALGEARREVTIVNKRGLHARASAKFVGAVAAMDGCEVRVARDGHSAAGGSILGLMMLGAAKGDTVELCVKGARAEERLAELVAMIEDGFGED